MSDTQPIQPIPAHIKLIADGIVMEARATICQGKEVAPEIFVLNIAAEQLQQPAMRMMDPEDRDQMAQETRLLADEMGADVVILLSEAWGRKLKIDEVDALMAQYGSISAMPDREEILLLTIETPDHYWQGKAPISGKGLNRRCGEVQYEQADAEGGRFTHFLMTEGEKAQLAATLAVMAKAWQDFGIAPESTKSEYGGEQRSLNDIMRRIMVRHRAFVIDASHLPEAIAKLARQLGLRP